LRVLDLSECKQITDDALLKIAHSCPYLEVCESSSLPHPLVPNRVIHTRAAAQRGQCDQDHGHEHRGCSAVLRQPEGAHPLGLLEGYRRR
jgi:hypothetical protein